MIKKIPTTIFTGFLGSGKTTIISNLIDHLQKIGKQVIYIKNELGYEDIDTKLIQEKKIKTKELLNGAIYHTLLGPLNSAIDDLVDKFNPDRIIIETAGTEMSANPLNLSLMINNHPKLIHDGLITIIDVVNFNGYEHLDHYSKDTTNFVDLIVFNKIELVSDERKKAMVGYVREYNEKSPIVEAPNGKLDPSLAFGMNFTTTPNKKDSDIDTFTYTSNKRFNQAKLEKVFADLPKNVIRFKGYVHTESELKIINGVFKKFTWVPQPEDKSNNQTKIIIIGYRVQNDEAKISKLLNSCQV